VRVEVPDAARVQLLLEDYAFFAEDPALFCRLLDGLVELRGRETVQAWQALARAGRWADVYGELMHQHYDPMYMKSMARNFAGFEGAEVVTLAEGSPSALADAARRLLAEAPIAD
jgi:tRNA 2-selenouridine synthase